MGKTPVKKAIVSKREPPLPSPRISIHFLGWGVFLLAVLTWIVAASYLDFRTARSQKTRMDVMVRQVTQLDQLLAAYARSGVTFGDMRSEGYYLESTLQRERVMAQIKELSPSIFTGPEALAMSAIKAEITGLENQAFDYVRAGNLNLADSLIFSAAYDDKEAVYKRDFIAFSAKLRGEMGTGYDLKRNKVLGMAAAGVLLIPFLGFLHSFLVGKITRFYAEYSQAVVKT